MRYSSPIPLVLVLLHLLLLCSLYAKSGSRPLKPDIQLTDTAAACQKFISLLTESEKTYRTYASSGKMYRDASALHSLNNEMLAHVKHYKEQFNHIGVSAASTDSIITHLNSWNTVFEKHRDNLQRSIGKFIPDSTRFAFENAGNKTGQLRKVAQKLVTKCLCGEETRLGHNGHSYALVGIGDQCWFAENLSTATFANGDTIPNITNNKAWKDLTTAAWADYANDKANGTTYGKLYNWHAVAAAQGLCPKGWHVPDEHEWFAMLNSIDATVNDPNAFSFIGWNAGGRMKTKGTQHWEKPNLGATNESGFSALPSGQLGHHGSFEDLSVKGLWWSASQRDRSESWYYAVTSYSVYPTKESAAKFRGFSVRCVRD